MVVFPVPGEPRRTAESALSAPEEPGEFPDPGVAVVEGVGDEGELKDIGIAKEGLVVAEGGERVMVGLERMRLLKAGRAWAENE